MRADAPADSRTEGRGRRNYVLPLAIVLVLGQIAAFVAIKMSRDKDPAKPAAVAAADPQKPGAPGAITPTNDLTARTTDAVAPAPAPTPTADPPTTADPPVEPPVADVPVVVPDDVDDKPRVKRDRDDRRESAREKAAREKAERIARDKAERDRDKAERERRDDEAKRQADARRMAELERARLAAEVEKERQGAEKAKAEAAAEASRLEAERIKAEAAKQVAAADASKGSSTVLVLVLGPGVSGASREAIKNVYLGKTSVWPNGTTARPMNRPAGSAAGRKFYGSVLGMSSGAFREHWSELQLSGGGISPTTISSPTTMVAKVAATRGGIGYVLESELPENTTGVKLVPLK